MIINHNIAALNTHRQMGSAQSAQMNNMEKLSSGMRINSAKDDAAGLTISEKMRGQIRGLEQGSRNAQDGISMIQTAEGALSITQDILQRMRELGVQASNDTNTSDDRAVIQKEISALTEEINRVGNNTEFNTKKLVNGDAQGVGVGATQESIGFDFSSVLTGQTGSTVLSIGGEDYTIVFDDSATNADGGTADSAVASTKTITIATSGSNPENLGARLKTGFDAMIVQDPNLSISKFSFTQTGETVTISATAGEKYDGQAGDGTVQFKSGVTPVTNPVTEGANGTNGTLTFQVGANSNQQMALNINDMRAVALGVASVTPSADADGISGNAAFASGVDNQITKDVSSGTEYALDMSSSAKATDAIKVIDEAIKKVSEERSKLGATQNRLDHTINNLNTSSENLTAAESRIRDVDYTEAA
ncbi:flagellin [Planococcus kocurii]|uniref:flagellin N-terminal helical domain-containing protein n=1 Tax=Planococcus kocurii TaxID=1374 RepID=UPI003CFC1B33